MSGNPVRGSSNPNSKTVRILAFGDSLTSGYRLNPEQAYPKLLEKELHKRGLKNLEILNAGVSGDTSSQGLRRIQWTLKNGPFDYVLVALGANDGLRLLPPKNLESNLEKTILEFKKTGAKVILVGIKIPINLDPDFRKQFESIYPRLAKKMNLPFYPFLLEGVAADPELNLDDQIHPNSQGHEVIAQKLSDFLFKILKDHR